MDQGITLPPGVAIGVIAFLLALLPASLFMWLWYLRRHDRPVPALTVAFGFAGGLILVAPAYWAERWSAQLWQALSPDTAYQFAGAILPLVSLQDVALPAIGTFIIVATIEEGLRYLFLFFWIRHSKQIDQVFDGLVVGVAAGLGFATLENTIYFLHQLQSQQFDTLVFVFFLRFLISTLAHITFGGLMGALLAKGTFSMYNPRRILFMAFWLTWFIHGLYDLLLSLNLSSYAILLLIPPLLILTMWTTRRDFFVINRKKGQLLVFQEAPQTRQSKLLKQFFQKMDSPWNKHAPWLNERRRRGQLIDELTTP